MQEIQAWVNGAFVGDTRLRQRPQLTSSSHRDLRLLARIPLDASVVALALGREKARVGR